MPPTGVFGNRNIVVVILVSIMLQPNPLRRLRMPVDQLNGGLTWKPVSVNGWSSLGPARLARYSAKVGVGLGLTESVMRMGRSSWVAFGWKSICTAELTVDVAIEPMPTGMRAVTSKRTEPEQAATGTSKVNESPMALRSTAGLACTVRLHGPLHTKVGPPPIGRASTVTCMPASSFAPA